MIFPERVTKAEVNELPLLAYEGNITLIDNISQMGEALRAINREPVIGFDTETKPTFRRGEYNYTALLQIAIPNQVFLFRLNLMGFPDALAGIFTDRYIKKIGISIADDIKELKRLNNFREESIIEINDIAKTLGIENQGVRNLSAIFLQGRISKRQQISNWENEVLTEPQMRYAATDAWVCLEIYTKLMKQGFI